MAVTYNVHGGSLAALTLTRPFLWSNKCQAGFEATKILVQHSYSGMSIIWAIQFFIFPKSS